LVLMGDKASHERIAQLKMRRVDAARHATDLSVLATLLLSFASLQRSLMARRLAFGCCILCLLSHLALAATSQNASKRVRYDGSDWHLKGDGIVCCPCTVPCPCRTNDVPSYGHCEATLYLRIRQGHYGSVSLDGMQLIDAGGMCAINYNQLSSVYFDTSASPAQQTAFMEIVASFSLQAVTIFPHVRVAAIRTQVTGDHLFNLAIPGILEIIVDRNWGQSSPPMPMVAAPDHFSNLLQYIQNIQYRMHDPEAGLDFDYSHRQANYRIVNIGVDQYRSKSMLIQFGDGKGWFNARQMELIKAQHLAIPQLDVIRKEALRLRESGAR
jgi:hypothetical protein